MNLPWYTSGLSHIWLPYTQMQTSPLPQAVVGTEGCRIKLADGRELIDGISSWWSVCHGYNHPHIMQAVQQQLEVMPHVMFGGLVHEQALTLASRLAALTGLPRVFFSDSGSTSVEVALKIALQYWQNRGQGKKTTFVCFEDGYHGDTFGAMGVSDPGKSMHKAFAQTVAKQHVLPIPRDEKTLVAFETTLAKLSDTVAGMIIEPLVQGAGGLKFHEAATLAKVYALAKKYDMLFIADEIATGFYRTGQLFACNEAGITPDIMCLGKALTGGMMGLGATLIQEDIFAAFLSNDPDAALMHGPTFMANALACAAANAALDLFEQEPRKKQVAAIEQRLREGLEPCRLMPGVVDVRVKGAIGVVQMAPEIDVRKLRPRFVEQGVWVRPFGDIVYLMPPLVISEEELQKLIAAVGNVLRAAM